MTIESVLTQLESLHAASTQAKEGFDCPLQYREAGVALLMAAHNHLPAVIAEVRRLRGLDDFVHELKASSMECLEEGERLLKENTALKAEVERMRDALTTIVDRADRTDIGWWAVSPYAYEVAKAALGESK